MKLEISLKYLIRCFGPISGHTEIWKIRYCVFSMCQRLPAEREVGKRCGMLSSIGSKHGAPVQTFDARPQNLHITKDECASVGGGALCMGVSV
jgi:hypothetical protein